MKINLESDIPREDLNKEESEDDTEANETETESASVGTIGMVLPSRLLSTIIRMSQAGILEEEMIDPDMTTGTVIESFETDDKIFKWDKV